MKNKILFLFMLTLLVITVPITALADDDDRASGGGGSEVMVTLHYCDDEDTTVTFNAGYMENMPKSPTKPNYRFTGWYTERDYGLEVSEYFNRTYDVPKNWYAHWTNVSSFTYTIPAELKIDNSTNKGAISFSGVLDKMHSLNVTVTSQNSNKLVNGDQNIGYSVDKNSFSYQSGSKSKTINETINILVNGKGTVAGSYNDKLTFNISIEQLTLTSGDVIDIEGKDYTVIENVQGNQYKVLTSDTFEKPFDDNKSNNYANSTIATYLDNDYYNSLDANIKNAIVEISIQQNDIEKISKTNGYCTVTYDETQTRDAGTHKVFVPSWDEITRVYGTNEENWKKFLLSKYSGWIRDFYSSYAFSFSVCSDGSFTADYPNERSHVRPAFVLDLSKVSFTKVEPGSSDEVTDDTEVIAPVMVENIEPRIEEPTIIETNKGIVPEETDKPKDNETTENTDVVEEPSTSESVDDKLTEVTNESAVVAEPNTEEETEWLSSLFSFRIGMVSNDTLFSI